MKWIEEATDYIKAQTALIEDPFTSEVQRILLEAEVQWLNAQVFVIGQLLNDPQIHAWGKDNVKNWENKNNKQKMNDLFQYFSGNGTLEKAREYMVKSPKVDAGSSSMHYEIPEITEPPNGIESEHWNQFKESSVFKDLVLIFLNHI